MSALQDKFEYKWIVAVTFVLGLFLEIMDTTIMNVAIPTLEEEFGASAASMEWVVIGYLLALAVWIPASGWIGDKVGTKKTFLFALFLFTAASALCGQSNSLGQLIVFRLLQGVGGGMLVPVGTAMLYRSFPPAERARASTILIVPTVVAPALGPIIGGAIVDNTSWRWIFLVNLPIGIIALVITNKALRLPFTPMQRKVDYVGATLLVISVSCLILGLSWTGGSYGWLSAPTIAFFAAALIVSIAFFRWESRAEEPIIPLHLMKIDVVRAIVPLMILVGAVFYGANAFMPLYLQGVTGVSATNSGLLLVPLAVAVAGTAIIIGRITSRTGTYKVWPPVGAALALVGFIMASLLGSTHAYLYLAMIASFFIGAGMGAIFPTSTLAVQNAVESHEIGAASSIVIFVRQLGGAIGLAIYGAIFNAQLEGRIDEKLIQTPRNIKQLESPLREAALEVFAHAVTTVFRMAIPVLIVTVILSCLIPGRQLKGRAEVTSP
mgnify:CR=1 FL=1